MAFTSNTATCPLEDSVSGDGDLQPDDVSPIKNEPPKAPQHVNVDHNELLDFGISIGYLLLLDCFMRQCQVSITAQLYGRFSLSGNAFQTSQLKHGVPKQGVELICYRRNLFQIAGSVALPPGLRYVMSLGGNRIPIPRICNLRITGILEGISTPSTPSSFRGPESTLFSSHLCITPY